MRKRITYLAAGLMIAGAAFVAAGGVTYTKVQVGLALAGLLAGIGVVLAATGGGLIWAGRADQRRLPATRSYRPAQSEPEFDELTEREPMVVA